MFFTECKKGEELKVEVKLLMIQCSPGGPFYFLKNRTQKYDTFTLHDTLKSVFAEFMKMCATKNGKW